MTHAQLVRKAVAWLRAYRCGVILSEQACLSGEALLGMRAYGIDFDVVRSIATQVRTVHDLGVNVGIVIGGGISKAGDALFEPLRAELRRQITHWSAARIDIVPAALGDDSVLYGALALAKSL